MLQDRDEWSWQPRRRQFVNAGLRKQIAEVETTSLCFRIEVVELE
jgi:hypothetical protein